MPPSAYQVWPHSHKLLAGKHCVCTSKTRSLFRKGRGVTPALQLRPIHELHQPQFRHMSTKPHHCSRRSNTRPQISIRCQMLLPSLVNTRRTLVNARASLIHALASCPPASLQRPPRYLYSLSETSLISRKHTQNARKRSCNTRTYAHELPANSLRVARQRHYNTRPQISIRCHMLLPSLVNTRETLVNSRVTLVRALTNYLQVVCECEQVIGAREPDLMPPRAGFESSQSAKIPFSPSVVCYPANPRLLPPLPTALSPYAKRIRS